MTKSTKIPFPKDPKKIIEQALYFINNNSNYLLNANVGIFNVSGRTFSSNVKKAVLYDLVDNNDAETIINKYARIYTKSKHGKKDTFFDNLDKILQGRNLIQEIKKYEKKRNFYIKISKISNDIDYINFNLDYAKKAQRKINILTEEFLKLKKELRL